MNKIQRLLVSIATPVMVILVSFAIIGSNGSNIEGETGIAFDPIRYLARNGIEWSLVVASILLFELYWWKDPKNMDK